MGAGQLDTHLSDKDVSEVDHLLHLHLGLHELVPGAALQLGQQLHQGFSCLVSVLGHRLHELVLLRSGGGYCAGHHGLVELVLVTILKLDLLDLFFMSA